MNISGPVSCMDENRSGVLFNFSNNKIEIRLGDNSLGQLVHELKHAYQFEKGVYSSVYMRDSTPFYDKSDEVEAYAEEFIWR